MKDQLTISFTLTKDQWCRMEGVIEQQCDEFKSENPEEEAETIDLLDSFAQRIYNKRNGYIVEG